MAQASSAQPLRPQQPPSGKKANPLQNAFAMIADFIPWIVYWSLVGNVPFRVAVTIACAISVGLTAQTLLRQRTPKALEVGASVVFVILLVVTFLTNDRFLERWLQPLTNGGLFLITLASILIGKPFTLQYAREHTPPEIAETRGFLRANQIITWVWVIAFALMTLSSLIPPLVQGRAALTDAGSLLSIIFYLIVPFSFLGLAALFTHWFPDWFARRMGGRSAGSSPNAPQPPADAATA